MIFPYILYRGEKAFLSHAVFKSQIDNSPFRCKYANGAEFMEITLDPRPLATNSEKSIHVLFSVRKKCCKY